MGLLSERVATLTSQGAITVKDPNPFLDIKEVVSDSASLEPTIQHLRDKLADIISSLEIIDDILARKKELSAAKKHISSLLAKLEVAEEEEEVPAAITGLRAANKLKTTEPEEALEEVDSVPGTANLKDMM